MNRKRILLIDEDASTGSLLTENLCRRNYDIIHAHKGREGLNLLQKNLVHLVLQNTELPDMIGMELLSQIKYLHPKLPVIALASNNSNRIAVSCVKNGAYDFLAKPLDVKQMQSIVQSVFRQLDEYKRTRTIKTRITDRFQQEGIIGKNPAMIKVYDLVEKVANKDIPVLIQGESGTGKELIAKAIHDFSLRKDEPFVDVNCAAIPANLLESELFGHEAGAFTDAKCQRIGKFELAGNGTLFLDEIGEMSASVQAKILRTLQEKVITRVGSNKKIKVNCRILTATNKELTNEIKQGQFRNDLYYRVAAFPIIIPPLRDRFDDILLLVPYFMQKYGGNDHIPQISPQAVKLLMGYKWPGNVRELENAIHRALILSDGNDITLKDLPAELHYKRASDKDSSLKEILGSKVLPFDKIEKEVFKHALRVDEGNITKAAKDLGIARATLYRKLEKYDLLKDTK